MNKKIIGLALLLFTGLSVGNAQQVENTFEQATSYVSDELTVFLHSGAGKNYRIVGTISAGEQVVLTGNSSNDFTEIVTNKDREAWIETQYLNTKPGLRFVVAELNAQLASQTEKEQLLAAELDQARITIDDYQQQISTLKKSLGESNQQLAATQSKVKDQDTEIKKQWFFNGAIVLGVGLLLGLIIPKLFTRRRSSMESWR